MEGIVEAFHMLDVAFVADGCVVFVIEFLHPVVNVVIVVRVVLVRVDFVGQTILETLSEVGIRFVRIERTVGIRGIQKPVPSLFVGHDVDDTSQGIGPETYGYHSLIHLNTFGKVYRNVVQVECGSGSFLGYTVDKYFYVLAAEAVEHQLHVRAYTARFAQLHSWKFLKRFAQVFGRVLQFLGIYSHRIEGRPFDTSHSAGNHYHFFQFGHGRFQDDVLTAASVGLDFYFFFCCLKTDGRNHQRVFSGRRFQVEQAFLIGRATVLCTFQIYRGKVDDAFVRGKYFPG